MSPESLLQMNRWPQLYVTSLLSYSYVQIVHAVLHSFLQADAFAEFAANFDADQMPAAVQKDQNIKQKQ